MPLPISLSSPPIRFGRAYSRDHDETPFTAILRRYLARTPGACGMVLVDAEGEAVDYAGGVASFELRVEGATWAIVAAEIRALRTQASGRSSGVIAIGLDTASIVLRFLPDGYTLVVKLKRGAAFIESSRATAVAVAELSAEAGWHLQPTRWVPVEVVCDREGRPATLSAPIQANLEVLGVIAATQALEKGFRVRLSTGQELTLAREAYAHWYAEEPVGPVTVPKNLPPNP